MLVLDRHVHAISEEDHFIFYENFQVFYAGLVFFLRHPVA